MGVINVTPDSFYTGSRKQNLNQVLQQTSEMIEEGATFIDIGGYSSRPGADHIPESEELQRVIEPIKAISEEFPEAIVSIDTFRARIAEEALAAGASMINDISGGDLDPKLPGVAIKNQVPYIMMHMKGTPQTMKEKAEYDDLLKDITLALLRKIEDLTTRGLKDIIIDPGFGFAKNIDQNFELLSKLDLLHMLDRPLLVGLSRKSMIYKTLKVDPAEALNGTTVVNTLALLKGASILRVHDVKEAIEAITLVGEIQN